MHPPTGVEASSPSFAKQFVDWEEQFVSHDRGSRVVHYRLKDCNGLASLAVVGTERSLRHMVYVVCDEFLPLAGLDKSNTPAFKWRSRREVVDWLTTFITRPRCSSSGSDHNVSKSPLQELSMISDYDVTSNGEENEFFEGISQDEGAVDIQNNTACIMPPKDIVWVGAPWTCRKRLRHYPSFQRNGITIPVNSFVYVMSESREHHIAYIEDMYDDKKCKKKVRVRWFHKLDELVGPVPPPAPHAREVFITPFPQVLSVECVDGGATVLTPEHYEKCLSTLPPFAAQVHVCFRQFDNEGIKPFNISDVKGYWQQKALTLIHSSLSQGYSQNCDLASDCMEYEDEENDIKTVIKRGPRAARSSRKRNGTTDLLHGGYHGEVSLALKDDISRLTCNNTADAGPGSNTGETKLACGGDPDHLNHFLLDASANIELLCEDSGLRGCWFRCTVLRSLSHRVKVRYEELDAEDGCGKLEEWVSSGKCAAPDKLGIRASGRSTMRPSCYEVGPPHNCEVGVAVDAWWNDGWWEGVIVGKEHSGKVKVYFPGENDTALFNMPNLRISRDWVHGQWVEVKCTYDIEKLMIARASSLHSGMILSDKGLENNKKLITISLCGSGSSNSLLSQVPVPLQAGNSAKLRAQEIEICEGKQHICGNKNEDKGAALLYGMGTGEDLVCRYSNDEYVSQDHPAHQNIYICGDNGGNFIQERELDAEDRSVIDSGKRDESTEESIPSDELRWTYARKRPRQAEALMSEKSMPFTPREKTPKLVDCSYGKGDRNPDYLSPKVLVKSKEDDDIEELPKSNKAQPGHENIKPLHGSISGSMFNSMPLASLVMSR